MTVAADVLGLRELQAETLARRRAMAERLGDDEALAAALSGAALLADRMGDREGAGALAQEGLVLAERIGKAADAAVCWGELAWLSIQRGEIEQALQQTEHGLAWARRARDADPAQAMYEMQLLAVLAFALGADQRIEQQRDVLLQTLALAQARNEMRVLCSAHMGLADAALALADEAAARHHVQALADIAQLTGEVVHQGGAHRMSALIDLAVGLPQSALVRARESHVLYAGTGSRDYIVSALVAQGLAQLQMAQPEAALKVLRAALVVAQRLGDVAYTKVCCVLRARAHTLRDDAAAAMAEIAAAGALDEANALGHSTLALYARVALWQACARLATLQAAVPEGEGAAAMARHQLRLAAATLKRHTDRLQDPEVRQRVLQLPLHWQIAEGCEAAGLPGF
jgi:tetratricopeptide (TPR) repeat protein